MDGPPNPKTGDEVLVGWDIHRNKMVYRINGGPSQDVARHIEAKGLDVGRTAMELLCENAVQCQVTDNEELALP